MGSLEFNFELGVTTSTTDYPQQLTSTNPVPRLEITCQNIQQSYYSRDEIIKDVTKGSLDHRFFSDRGGRERESVRERYTRVDCDREEEKEGTHLRRTPGTVARRAYRTSWYPVICRKILSKGSESIGKYRCVCVCNRYNFSVKHSFSNDNISINDS